MQVNNISNQIGLMEANLRYLAERMPEVPTDVLLICRLITLLGRQISAVFEPLIRPTGLVEAEFRSLATLYAQPGGCAHPSDLCRQSSQSPANMPRISDTLVGRGFLTRDSRVKDRRKTVLRITDKGESLVRRVLPTLWGPLDNMSRNLPEIDQRQFVELLKRLGVGSENTTGPVNGSALSETACSSCWLRGGSGHLHRLAHCWLRQNSPNQARHRAALTLNLIGE